MRKILLLVQIVGLLGCQDPGSEISKPIAGIWAGRIVSEYHENMDTTFILDVILRIRKTGNFIYVTNEVWCISPVTDENCNINWPEQFEPIEVVYDLSDPDCFTDRGIQYFDGRNLYVIFGRLYTQEEEHLCLFWSGDTLTGSYAHCTADHSGSRNYFPISDNVIFHRQ